MFERFAQAFETDPTRATAMPPLVQFANLGFRELLTQYSGCSFNKGLYRIVNPETVAMANPFLAALAPEHGGRLCAFGYDWSGNIFAVDPHDPEAHVLMFEPGTANVLSSEMDILTLHNSGFVDRPDDAFGRVFLDWLAGGAPPLKYMECLGFKIPLFLSGEDTVDNLEVSGIEVYWDISGQLAEKTRNLPPGTRIGKVTLKP